MHVVTIAALVAAAYGGWRGRAAVAGTTLLSAWRWGVSAIVLSLAAAVAELLGTTFRSVADHLWYASCVLWVCPAVAVLGARRPGSGAWGAFVMIPLVLVLEWPVTGVAVAGRVSGVSSGPLLQNVHLDWPELVAWLVVLVLGTGAAGRRGSFAQVHRTVMASGPGTRVVVVGGSRADPLRKIPRGCYARAFFFF